MALFHSSDVPVRDKASVDRAQENMAYLLQRYLHVKLGSQERAVTVFARLMGLLAELRKLADLLRNNSAGLPSSSCILRHH